MGLAHTYWYMGRFAEAADNVTDLLARYDRSKQADYLRLFTLDPKVFALSIGAWNEWHLDNLANSVASADAAIACAKEFGNPLNLEHACSSAGRLYLLRGEPETMSSHLDDAANIAERCGFKMRIAITKTMRGWLACQRGEYETGVSYVRKALIEYRLSGGRADLSWYLATLVTALHGAGHTEEAFATLAQAEEYVVESGEAWWAAEIARLKGDFCLSDQEAEANYRRALDIAQRQRARSWALRSAISLTRLLVSRKERSEGVGFCGRSLRSSEMRKCARHRAS
jgi:tetratricopeptide (TPR) repeat protein